jgi:cell division protein FtsN
MKNLLLLIILCLLVCNGCKFFKRPSTRTVDTLTAADTIQSEPEIVDSAAYYTGITEAQAPPSVPAPSTITTSSTASRGTYYMIVGSFTVHANAERYAEKLRGMGYHPQIITGRENFQMVSAKSYDSYREGLQDLDKFRSEVSLNAWIYSEK